MDTHTHTHILRESMLTFTLNSCKNFLRRPVTFSSAWMTLRARWKNSVFSLGKWQSRFGRELRAGLLGRLRFSLLRQSPGLLILEREREQRFLTVLAICHSAPFSPDSRTCPQSPFLSQVGMASPSTSQFIIIIIIIFLEKGGGTDAE